MSFVNWGSEEGLNVVSRVRHCIKTGGIAGIYLCFPDLFDINSPFNTSQVRTRSTTKISNHCLENQKGYYLRNRNTGK
jgi:hypothetical protein